jgi:dTDP-4-dehydrorhamnose 3,5-epimerase
MKPIILQNSRFGDDRGWFSETYSAEKLKTFGIDVVFVQDNHSYSASANTIRGIHFQTPPCAQAKLVRCLRGEIWDVIVDLRSGSPTFGQWAGVILSAENNQQLFVPEGYGHGFQTLSTDCEIVYKVSEPYSPENDGGIAWDDPAVGIEWKAMTGQPILSSKDVKQPTLDRWNSNFVYNDVPFDGIDLDMGGN